MATDTRLERINTQARAVGARLAVYVDREAHDLARLIAADDGVHPAVLDADRQYAERTIVAQVVEVLRDL